MFLLWLRQLPCCGDRTPASVPPRTEGRSSPTNIPVSLPSSFVLPSFAWFPISFPLVRFSCPCSAGVLSVSTSVSDDVFPMYPWREMYSTSTYSFAILFFYSSLLSKPCILNDSDLTSQELNKANLTLNLPYSYQFVTLNNFSYFSRVWSFYL